MQLDHQYDNANHATVLLDIQEEAPISFRSQKKVKMGVKMGRQWRRFPKLLGPAMEWLGEDGGEWMCKRGMGFCRGLGFVLYHVPLEIKMDERKKWHVSLIFRIFLFFFLI
jgi:hypothetical protein